jgi:hypothetical protein
MKTFTASMLAISLITFAGCSTTHPANGVKADSETVMVTYHVQPGKEADFQALLAHAWDIYRAENAVYAQPHVVIRYTEETDKPKFVEIFTWAKSPDHPSPGVLAIWKQEQSLCEVRDGQTGIEGGEVELITGK